jgi:hypothetical protein
VLAAVHTGDKARRRVVRASSRDPGPARGSPSTLVRVTRPVQPEDVSINGPEEDVMNTQERWFPGHLRELDTTDCWELVRAHEVGRVAFVDDRGPMVVPITFTCGTGSVLFRVAAYSEVGRHLAGARVALEVDDFDPFTRSGWNVVLRGVLEVVEIDQLPPPEDRPTPWPEGLRSLFLQLTPDTVTGRRLLEA